MTAPARPRLAVALLPVGLLLFAGCSRDNTPDTGIIVEVSSDLRVSTDIDEIQLTATDPQGNSLYQNTFDLVRGPNLVKLPFRVGLFPFHDTATPIHIEAVGQLSTSADSQPVVSRSATLSFIQHKKVMLELPLLAVCKKVVCSVASKTCKENGDCEPDEIDTSTLNPYVPNQPAPGTDAATVIPDAATSADAMDGAVDTAADGALNSATDAAGGRDAFPATGGAGGTGGPSGTGGVIGTGGGTAAAGGMTASGGTMSTGGTGNGGVPSTVPSTGGTTTTGGTTPSGGTTSSGGTTTAGGTTASGGTATSGGTTTTGGTIMSGGMTSGGGAITTGGTTASGGTTSVGGSTTAGGTIASGGATNAGGTTTAGGTIASGGSTGNGGVSGTGGTTGKGGTWGGTAPSCSGLAATCGPSNESCCTSSLVPGGTFDRSYDGVDYLDPNYPATVDDFYLDKYEITVGRFRQFVNAGMGTQDNPPGAGAGAHPGITGSGWDSTWNANLSANTASLKTAMKCSAPYQTWTDTAGSNESKPVNCLDWYTAFAFCAWDGGRLPTEAEWNYAAAGGSEQRYYPWSSPATSTTIDASYAVYASTAAQNVGSKSPTGDGKWGQSDLAGNMWEWTLDWYASAYPMPCNNCADLTAASFRVIRGGYFDGPAGALRSAYRGSFFIGDGSERGSRCARDSL